jgi:lipopolysaccharide export system permease protein
MTAIGRGRLAGKYIFFEMLPSFVIGVIVFLFIILMFQSFRLSEYIIVHGADLETVGRILGYLAISFLPVILPMSLLFAVLLTYGRMSADSEIVAFKALGLNMWHISLPAVLMAAGVAALSAQVSFQIAPWGNRQMEVLTHRLGQLKPGASIREGVFSEGFFNLVVYANKVDSNLGLLEKVFIYDEREENSPMTIIAKSGKLIKEDSDQGASAFLRLFDGSIHRNQEKEKAYTKLDFESFDIHLFDPVEFTHKRKTPLSYTFRDLRQNLNDPEISDKKRKLLNIEWNRRWAIAFACLLFAFIGVGLGTSTNRRSGRSSGLVLSIVVVVAYWVLYAGFENLGKNGHLPIVMAVWTPNLVFAAFALWAMRKT